MIRFLAKFFIKDSQDFSNPQVREKYGVLTGAVGIFFNVFLFLVKLLAGLLSSSVAVIADAFNNLSDASGSIITILGFKISSKKPDKDHPFGHGRLEYVAGLIVSFLILIMGYELLKSSVSAIKNPISLKTDFLTIGILGISIFVKFYMFFYNKNFSKKINSVTLLATAKDSLNDTISTSVVLLSVIVNLILNHYGKILNFSLDGIAGLFVSIFIIKGGLDSVKETVNPLIGTSIDKDLVLSVEKVVLSHKKICGMHDCVIHDYGPGRFMISFHAEVSGDENIFEAHDEIDNLESEISKKFNCSCVIHMDPIDKNNVKIEELKNFILEKAQKIDPNITIHDLRLVPGPSHTNVIFDAVRPFSCKKSEIELKNELCKIVKDFDSSYIAKIQIDTPYCS